MWTSIAWIVFAVVIICLIPALIWTVVWLAAQSPTVSQADRSWFAKTSL
jgi:hypothetical protein